MDNKKDYEEYKQEFEESIQELRKMHSEDPETVTTEVSDLVEYLKVKPSEKVKKLELNKMDATIISLICLSLLVIGLINVKDYSLYIFGFIFLVAGIIAELASPKGGLIFLFSHGMTGLGLMIVPQILPILSSPLMSDKSMALQIYLGIIAALVVIATIIFCIYASNEEFRKKDHIVLLPISLYALAIILSELSQILIPYIYQLIG